MTPKHKIMGVATIIDEESITLVQGVNGILLRKKGWMKERQEGKG